MTENHSATLSLVNSDPLSGILGLPLCNDRMRTVEEVRRLRLGQLRKEFGSYAALNELMGKSKADATLSQIATKAKDSKTGKIRELGSIQARRLEGVCKKPGGWMDLDPAAVCLPGWDELPPEKQEELEELFGKYVVGELAKLKVNPPKDDPSGQIDVPQTKPPKLNH